MPLSMDLHDLHGPAPAEGVAKPPSTRRAAAARALTGLAGLAAVAVLAACGPSTGTAGSGGPAYGAAPRASGPPASTPASTAAAAVATRQVALGTILTDQAGRSLYLFEQDTGTRSTCTGACAQAWPPLLSSGTPTAGTGVTSSLIGTTRRGEGSVQVTYAGHPLYSFSGDTAPGQTNGEGSKAFGGGWYVLTPQGTKIHDD